MGVAYNKLEKYQKAIKACLKAIKIKSDFYEADFFESINGFLIIALLVIRITKIKVTRR
jgi:tetratricopeptide (TPR) repeat protein